MTALNMSRATTLPLCTIAVAACSGGHIDGSDEIDTPVVATQTCDGVNRNGVCFPAGPYSLQGTVFDAYAGPLAAEVWMFLTLPNDARSLWVRVPTDGAGRFTVTELPESRVGLAAGPMQDYVQPCGVTVDLRGDVVQDLEIVATATLDSLDPPRPLTSHGATFVGTVFEITSAGRQPLSGASIEVSQDGLTRATTRTDFNGRYFLCDLPSPTVWFTIYKDSYVVEAGPIDTTQAATLDIEFKRLFTVW